MTGGPGAGSTTGDLCAVVLAAGAGTRLRPLTALRPKALCPVGNQPILDRVLSLVAGLGLAGPRQVAVNACWLGGQIADHLAVDGAAGTPADHAGGGPAGAAGARPAATERAYVSMESAPLGTAGGVANLRDWIAGRPVLVGNADAYLAGSGLAALLDGWDRQRVRLLGVPAPPGLVDAFGADRFAGFSLLPWHWVCRLADGPSELVTAVWRPAEAAGALEVIRHRGRFIDIGTPGGYLAANRHAAATVEPDGGSLIAGDAVVTGDCRQSVVGSRARVHGHLTRSVVWPDGRVAADEHLVDAVRVGSALTVRA